MSKTPEPCGHTWTTLHEPDATYSEHVCKLPDWPGHLHVCYCDAMWVADE